MKKFKKIVEIIQTPPIIVSLFALLFILVSLPIIAHSIPSHNTQTKQPLATVPQNFLFDAETLSVLHSKRISYPKRKTKRVCGNPSKKNGIVCLSEVATDNSGKLLLFKKPSDIAPVKIQSLSDSVNTLASIASFATTRFHVAYNLPCTPGGPVATNCSQPAQYGPATVAVVIWGGDPTIEQDLAVYDQQFNLPSCTISNGCLTVVDENGGSNLPAPAPDAAGTPVALETSLDVQTVHSMCQTCKIVLVEAGLEDINALGQAVDTAAGYHPQAISMSWGDQEPDTTAYDHYFDHPGIALVAGSGDGCYNNTCYPSSTVAIGSFWPASLPNVISVGGTTLQLNADGSYGSETAWGPQTGNGGGGSSCSNFYSAESWQTSLPNWTQVGCAGKRAVADISADGDPSTGVAVYYGPMGGWLVSGGTSLATPLVAASIALAGGLPSGVVGTSVLYQNQGKFHDITSGSNGSCNSIICQATVGYDGPTGLGTPNGLSGFIGVAPTPTATPTQQTFPACNTAPSCSNTVCSAPQLTCGTNNGTFSGCVYTQLAGGGPCNSAAAPDQPCTVNNCQSGTVCTNGLCSTPTGTPPSATPTQFVPTVTQSTGKIGDINHDGVIDLLDVNALLSKWNTNDSTSDLNHDGIVNTLDLSILLSNLGK